ncbi:alpha/beta fold hydrolase [Paenibacillus sp. GSMTC-2017]|nr:alpha/beta fold hydrolase [Paenibacillus sp. GSMTC-2017]
METTTLTKKPVLLFLHGFKGFKDWGFFPYAAESFAKLGYAVITFNFSHNGVKETDFDELDKFGGATHSKEQFDIEYVVDALQDERLPLSEYLDKDRLLIVGHSRGGGNSVIFASAFPGVKAAVAWNGIADCNLFGEAFREQVLKDGIGYVDNARTKQQMPIQAQFFEDLDSHKERYDIVAQAAGSTVPMIFIQGDQDSEFIRSGYERLRAEASQHQFITIEGANHTFGAKHPFSGTTDELEKAIVLTDQFLRGSVNL